MKFTYSDSTTQGFRLNGRDLCALFFSRRFPLAAIVILFLLGMYSPAHAQYPLVQAYTFVDSLILFPAKQESLYVLCSKKFTLQETTDKTTAERYVTFVGAKGREGVLLVALTLEPIANVKKDISLSLQFEGTIPKTGKVQTWGYVFDRNNDGVIDYLALMSGAAPFWAKDVPKYFPTRGTALTRENIELYIAHCGMIFNHWADDNFDRTIDGVIHADMFGERDWVKRRLVIKSSKYNDTFDDVSSFLKTPGDIADSIDVYDDGVVYYPLGKEDPAIFGKKNFDEINGILAILNQAVVACKMEKKLNRIIRRPVEEY